MQVGFDDGAGERELDVVVHDPDATVADLVRALDPARGDRTLLVDGVARPGDRRIDRAAITEGSTLSLTDEPAGPEPPAPGRAGPAVTLRVAGGLDSGASTRLVPGRVALGRGAPVAGLDSPTVSARHAVLTLEETSVTVADTGSRNGTWLDGAPVVEPTVVPPGSVLRVGAVHLITAGPADDRPTRFDAVRTTGPATAPFNRPPRSAPPPPPVPVDPPTPPEARAPSHPVGVVAIAAPIVMGLVMIKVFGSLLFGLFALLSPVVMLGTVLENRRRGRRGGRRDRHRFERELTAFRRDLAARADAERARLADELPDPAEVARRASAPSTRLWERRPHHTDALHVRIGVGPVRVDSPVPDGGLALTGEVRDAVEEVRTLRDAPVLLDLSAGGVVGLVGDRGAALAVARSLVVQAATHHGPADLPIVVVVAEGEEADWEWAKWLPHVRQPGGSGRRQLAADPESADRLFRSLLEHEPAAPVLVVLDDEASTEGRRAPGRTVLRREAVAGIVVAATEDRLPALCTTVVELRDADGTARVHRLVRDEVVDDVLAAGITGATAARIARALARFDDPELDVAGATLPASVGLLPLLGLDPPTPDGLRTRWASAGADPDLLAPLGVAEDGVLAVDLVRDGPHVLVAGTTGSGKSELLRTLVAGLAAAASPDHVTFVLIDFKGGSAFDRCAGLPHTVGVVTDLDAHLAQRALRCLEAELRHRERVLRDASAADLREYRRRAGGREPLPRLVVVVDEFATLKAELPDFVDALVGVAQRGRSLGVHLVLATQRPSGAVSENIRANTNLRIALRVQDAADSADVIDRPDAARIGRDQPGRALVRLGPGETEAIQTASSTGVATSGRGPVEVRPFRFAGPPPTGGQAVAGGADAVSDLDRLVDAASEAHRRSGRSMPRRPWPDPLPLELDLDLDLDLSDAETASPFEAHGATVPVARADDPDAQAQRPTGWVPSDGNLLLAGIRGSGTTTTCASIVVSLCRRMRPDDLHVHIVDMGAGDLGPLVRLPHVGAVVAATERERQARLLGRLRSELDQRRARPGGSAGESRIVLVLDGVGAFRAEWEDTLSGVWEDLQRVFADGPEVGVHTVLAADRLGAVPGSMQALVRQRWLFRPADPLELSVAGLRPGDLPELGPGRAIIVERAQEVQVARPAAGLAAAVARLAATTAPAVRRPPPTVGVLPAVVDPASLLPAARVEADTWVVPVGIASATLTPALLTLHPGEHALVAGPPRSGRSTALAAIGWIVHQARPAVTVVDVGPDGSRRALEDACRSTGPVLVLVDDADLVDDHDGTLAALVAGRRPDLHVVAAGRNDALRAVYGHWTRPLRASRTALLLQPDVDLDGDLAGVTLPRRTTVELTPGRGYLAGNGHLDLVQIMGLHETA